MSLLPAVSGRAARYQPTAAADITIRIHATSDVDADICRALGTDVSAAIDSGWKVRAHRRAYGDSRLTRRLEEIEPKMSATSQPSRTAAGRDAERTLP
jgi:hypothetical protein